MITGEGVRNRFKVAFFDKKNRLGFGVQRVGSSLYCLCEETYSRIATNERQEQYTQGLMSMWILLCRKVGSQNSQGALSTPAHSLSYSATPLLYEAGIDHTKSQWYG
ncbi:hypothetical protein DPMN_080457 [Dreissena polymorpha]|uniref:Uncharacterized protein n=1 Tax=Dreissena polymorpha TaxID=45954 RepID=A0A9D3YRF1_DREPO|nr:hypothetical protein DPMN_080457 [Dreissena polymorpha]